MVVGFTTKDAISSYHHKRYEFEPRSGEVYFIQHYVIKFVSDLWQAGGFLRVLRISSTDKTINQTTLIQGYFFFSYTEVQ